MKCESKWGGDWGWYELWIYQLRGLAAGKSQVIIVVQADGRPPAGLVLLEVSAC